jgi:hypothetical protein
MAIFKAEDHLNGIDIGSFWLLIAHEYLSLNVSLMPKPHSLATRKISLSRPPNSFLSPISIG